MKKTIQLSTIVILVLAVAFSVFLGGFMMILLACAISLLELFLAYALQDPNQPQRFPSIGWNG
jgi:hypothetical protein